MLKEYPRLRANLGYQQVGGDLLYSGVENPLPWMCEMIDLQKACDFFETRVIESQTGGLLSWN